MKKQSILFLLLLLQLKSAGQQTNISHSHCTDIMIQAAKGKWVTNYDLAGNVSPVQKAEAYKRLDIIHDILMKMYPNPTGVDIRVNRSAGITDFGATRKYRYTRDSVLTVDFIKQLPIRQFSYFANFSPHYCAHTNSGTVFKPGVSNENSDGIRLTVNDFAGVAGDPGAGDDWLIKGLPVRMCNTKVNEKWKGFEVYGDVRLRERSILIHREGMLPYIPVTRKQYLERCVAVTTKLFDSMIGFSKQMPVRSLETQEAEKKAQLAKFEKEFGKDAKRLKSAVDYYLSGYKTDQQVRDENITSTKKLKEEQLKKFTDELEKSSRQGLLDSVAVIRVLYISDLIFDTDPQTGSMLVTDNPDYIRKDLPAHVPQFMVFSWKWRDNYPPHNMYRKLLQEDFPIEKIRAMLDK